MKKRRIEVAVISDVHLGTHQCRAEELLAYLSSIRPKMLILNGGIIDRSRTATSYFPPSHFRVLKKIFSMAAIGTEVYYLCGKQEELMRSFKGYNLGNFHVRNKLLLELDGKKAWVFHGDVFDILPGACTWVTKFGNPAYGFLMGLNRAVNRVGSGLGKLPVSTFGRLRQDPAKSAAIIGRFEKTVSSLAIRNGYDYVVCGHLQRAEKQWIESPRGKTLYLNSGDWVESLTALEYNFKRWKLYRYNEDRLSPFFADEDLKQMDINDLIFSIMSKKEDRSARQKEKPSEK